MLYQYEYIWYGLKHVIRRIICYDLNARPTYVIHSNLNSMILIRNKVSTSFEAWHTLFIFLVFHWIWLALIKSLFTNTRIAPPTAISSVPNDASQILTIYNFSFFSKSSMIYLTPPYFHLHQDLIAIMQISNPGHFILLLYFQQSVLILVWC